MKCSNFWLCYTTCSIIKKICCQSWKMKMASIFKMALKMFIFFTQYFQKWHFCSLSKMIFLFSLSQKIWASQKIWQFWFIRHFEFLETKIVTQKLNFSQKLQQKEFFWKIIIFEILKWKNRFGRHLEFSRHFEFLSLDTIFFIFSS
jgi:hypothetical protein